VSRIETKDELKMKAMVDGLGGLLTAIIKIT